MPGIIRPLLSESVKHLCRLVTHREYRLYNWLVSRYGRTPRYTQRRIRFSGWNILVSDVASFLSAYRAIFVDEIYAFRTECRNPVILDCGANIGLSILFFKKYYPASTVIAYEADPNICRILRRNLSVNGITDVEVVNKAVWSSAASLSFAVDGADGGRVVADSSELTVQVSSVSLALLLNERRFDFVKIDIEGAEVEALKNCGDHLSCPHIFIEYHAIRENERQLGELISLLEHQGYRCLIHTIENIPKPFQSDGKSGAEMQLNLFFIRAQDETA